MHDLHPNEFFTVSRVCELTGLPLERLQLLEEEFSEHWHVRRTRAGNRLFTQSDIDRLQEMKRLMDEEGMDLAGVRATLFPPPQASPGDRAPESADHAGEDEEHAPEPDSDHRPSFAADSPLPEAADVTRDEPSVPPLPVQSTMDLLLEAAEGLVQENLKLRTAVDALGERCTRLEERLDTVQASSGRSRWRIFRRF